MKSYHVIFLLKAIIVTLLCYNPSRAMEEDFSGSLKFYRTGKMHFKQGKYSEVIAALSQVEENELDDHKKSNVHYWIGISYSKTGKHKKAVSFLSKIYESGMSTGFCGFRNEESLRGIHALGLSYYERQDYLSAYACLQVPLLQTNFTGDENFLKVVERTQALGMVGASLLEQGQPRLALPYLNQAIFYKRSRCNGLSTEDLALQDRVRVHAFCDLGKAYFRLGDFQGAYTYLCQALKAQSSTDYRTLVLRNGKRYVEALSLIYDTLEFHNDHIKLDTTRLQIALRFYGRKILEVSQTENVSDSLLQRVNELKKCDRPF